MDPEPMEPEQGRNIITFKNTVSYELSVDLQGDQLQVWMEVEDKSGRKNFGLALDQLPAGFGRYFTTTDELCGLLSREANFMVNPMKGEIEAFPQPNCPVSLQLEECASALSSLEMCPC